MTPTPPPIPPSPEPLDTKALREKHAATEIGGAMYCRYCTDGCDSIDEFVIQPQPCDVIRCLDALDQRGDEMEALKLRLAAEHDSVNAAAIRVHELHTELSRLRSAPAQGGRDGERAKLAEVLETIANDLYSMGEAYWEKSKEQSLRKASRLLREAPPTPRDPGEVLRVCRQTFDRLSKLLTDAMNTYGHEDPIVVELASIRAWLLAGFFLPERQALAEENK